MSFSVRQAFSQSFEILSARFWPMLAVTMIATVLSWAVLGSYMGSTMGAMMFDPAGSEARMMPGMSAGLILVYLVNFAIGLTGDAATCALCSDREDYSIGAALGAGVRSLPALAGAWLVFIIGMSGVGLVLAMAMGMAMMGGRNPEVMLLGALVVMVLCAYLGTKFSLILPVIAIDQVRNPFTAIGRSWELTRGNTFKIFAFYLIVMIVISAIALTLIALTIGFPQPGTVPNFGAIGGLMVAFVIFAVAIKLFFIAMLSAVHRQLSGPSASGVAAILD